MDFGGLSVVVVGLGKSGVAAAHALARHGAQVTGNDLRDRQALGVVADELEAAGVNLVLGGHPEDILAAADRIVVSPGVPPLPELAAAHDAGVPIVGEVELASWFLQGTVIGITGTNGKSTVTSLVGEMCGRMPFPSFVGGNLGTPLVDAIGTDAAGEQARVVVELSSFQLERVDRLRVHIAALLNIAEDHLDRYPDYAGYRAAKARIFERQQDDDHAVLPADDADARSLHAGPATVHGFGGSAGEVGVDGDAIIDRVSGLRFPLSQLGISGRHNVDNACAAALIARLAGVSPDVIAEVLRDFRGLPHRMQGVGECAGVRFFDDSKATNVGAACASLDGLSGEAGKVVLIAGGCHKGASYAPLADRLRERARAVVLIGEATPLIRDALGETAYPVEATTTLQEAVTRAAALAEAGDVVLLSPACSSYDMFKSYVERGEVFAAAVASLGEDA